MLPSGDIEPGDEEPDHERVVVPRRDKEEQDEWVEDSQ